MSEASVELFDEIQTILIQYASDVESPHDTDWTAGIKTALSKIGKEKGYHIACRDVDDNLKDWGEWLYDLTWKDYQEPSEMMINWLVLKKIILALECEWGNTGQVFDDFEKIIQSRAEYRVMIFDTNNDVTPKLVDELKQRVLEFDATEPGDKYLFCCWDTTDEHWYFTQYIV